MINFLIIIQVNYEIYANREKTAIDLCDYSIRNHICNGTSDVV